MGGLTEIKPASLAVGANLTDMYELLFQKTKYGGAY